MLFYFSETGRLLRRAHTSFYLNCVNRTACASCVGGLSYVTAPQQHKIILHAVYGYTDFKRVVFMLITVLLIHWRTEGIANRLTPGHWLLRYWRSIGFNWTIRNSWTLTIDVTDRFRVLFSKQNFKISTCFQTCKIFIGRFIEPHAFPLYCHLS